MRFLKVEGAGNDYVLTVSTVTACPWDCQEVANAVVDVADFLDLLIQWGMSGTPCDFGAGPPGVDTADFLELVIYWGPCP